MENSVILAKALSRFIRCSPFKLRTLMFGIRGKRLDQALGFLVSQKSKRTLVLEKVLLSAWANARVKKAELSDYSEVMVSLIKVDQGPVFKYSIPSARGRASVQRRRQSHVEVGLAVVNKNDGVSGGS